MSPVHQLSEGVVAVQFIEALSSSLTSSLEYCDCCRVGDEPNLQDNSNDNPSSIMCQQRRKSEMNGGVGDGVNQRRCSTSKDGSSVPLKRSYSSYLRLPIPSSKYYTDESMKIWKQMKMSNSYYYAWGANRARRMVRIWIWYFKSGFLRIKSVPISSFRGKNPSQNGLARSVFRCSLWFNHYQRLTWESVYLSSFWHSFVGISTTGDTTNSSAEKLGSKDRSSIAKNVIPAS